MIVFINGAFGVGKTTVAERLCERLPNSLLFDPEEVGFFLRNVLSPIDKPDDFQDYVLWRSLVVTTALSLRRTYDRTLIMPMCLWHPPYFEEVVGELRCREPRFFHFCLTAPVETIHAQGAIPMWGQKK
ncbi:MAG: tunicamycin resistance protein, partial [Armatimonadota bacterium]